MRHTIDTKPGSVNTISVVLLKLSIPFKCTTEQPISS